MEDPRPSLPLVEGNRQHTTVRHCVASVDDKVQHREFDLVGFDHGSRQRRREVQLYFYAGPHRAVDQIAHPPNDIRKIPGLELQVLLACEGEQSLRQRCATLHALQRAVDEAECPLVARQVLSKEFELASTAMSRLLKSWATPPVSWPIISNFCA